MKYPIGTRVTVRLYNRVEAGTITSYADPIAGPQGTLAHIQLDSGKYTFAQPRDLAQLA